MSPERADETVPILVRIVVGYCEDIRLRRRLGRSSSLVSLCREEARSAEGERDPALHVLLESYLKGPRDRDRRVGTTD